MLLAQVEYRNAEELARALLGTREALAVVGAHTADAYEVTVA
ncbi:hypothetical protein [Pyxidicoccus fallax]|nr:hypothetical protein [Pyxidicoccus fallax]